MAASWCVGANARADSGSTASARPARNPVERSDCRFTVGSDNRKKGEVYGYDGGKKVKGRKRHVVVDSQGLLLGVLVTEANASERLGAIVLLHELKQQGKLSRLEVLWVDQGYSGAKFAEQVRQVCGEHVRVEVIKRQLPGFEPLPKRWIVERTFGWLNRCRRLSKDYELHSEMSEAMIFGSLTHLMLRRLANS